jgi:two-component system, sensor histidine kinase and response regulator
MGIFRQDGDTVSLLCVEDDQVARSLLQRVIARKFPAMKIHSAENGKSGLEMFKVFCPDIVLTDIEMPSMNGILMASEIRKINPKTEIMILSGQESARYESDCSTIGINHYLHKPIEFQEVLQAIENSVASLMPNNRNYS